MATTTATATRRRPWIAEFYGSAIGKKYAMAISGIVGLGYVFAHMIGNLKIYLGTEVVAGETVYAIDEYGHFLRELLVPILPHHVTLWILRLVLIVALVVHVHAAYALTVMNRKARPTSYHSQRDYVVADFAARTMRWTGVIVLLFIGFHLADFTWGIQPAAPDGWERGAAYANFVATFSRPVVSAFYILANLALGLHLYHGVWSMFQSLGLNNRRFNHWRRGLAIGFTLVVVGGNITFPIAVMTGIVS
jgi:succinate dehydrogenase / fumarate reductase, cytochrome b subunit